MKENWGNKENVIEMTKCLKIKISVIIIAVLLITPFFAFIKSYFIMHIYSYMHYKDSFINELNIKVKMPGGLSSLKKDWYPFVITFNDDKGFSHFIRRNVNYTVLYNFGAFEYSKGASMLYNPNSSYYGAFYGAYFIRELESRSSAFGFDNEGNVDMDELFLPGTYDINKLVLEGFGLNDPVSKYSTACISDVSSYLDYDNWTVINTSVTTNGPNHKYKKNYKSYIQYGKPPKKYADKGDFPVKNFKSRIYIRYFEEKKCTVFIYIIAPNSKIIESCDKEILQKTAIIIK